MISKFRVAITLAAIALLTTEGNAIRIQHDISADNADAAGATNAAAGANDGAAGAGSTAAAGTDSGDAAGGAGAAADEDCTDGNCMVSEGNTDVTIAGAEDAEKVDVDIDDNGEPCDDATVKIDIQFGATDGGDGDVTVDDPDMAANTGDNGNAGTGDNNNANAGGNGGSTVTNTTGDGQDSATITVLPSSN